MDSSQERERKEVPSAKTLGTREAPVKRDGAPAARPGGARERTSEATGGGSAPASSPRPYPYRRGPQSDASTHPSTGAGGRRPPYKRFDEQDPNRGRFRKRRRSIDLSKINLDYKNTEVLERFISKTGKILPRRFTGASALVQRKISKEIKRARHIGLLPYTLR